MHPSAADRTITILRDTSFVLDAAAAAASMDPDRQPSRRAELRVTVAGGTTGSGTVTISGTVDGSADSETLTFSAAGIKRTVKMFSAIDASGGISTTGLADEASVPTVSVETLDEGGSPQAKQRITVAENVPASVTQSGQLPNWPARLAGTHEEDRWLAVIGYSEAWAPRVGDKLRDEAFTDEVWIVRGVRMVRSGFSPAFWECRIDRYETAA